MRLKIKEVSFTNEEIWIFKLSDGRSDFYILDEKGYKSRGLNSPITKHDLDYLDVGDSVLCEVHEFDQLNVVTKLR